MTTVTIFPNTEVPAYLGVADGTKVSQTQGTRFTVNVAGRATHIRWFVPTATQPTDGLNGGQVVFGLHRVSDGALLGSTMVSTLGFEGAWMEVALPAPITLTPGVAYQASILTPERYVYRTGFTTASSSPGGELTSTAPPGRWANASTFTLANGVEAGWNFYQDVRFELDATPPAGPILTLWNGTAEVAATATVWNGASEVSAVLEIVA
ncbi:DUF4082 domain-containing protein [Catenuloplanes sp. NPDC051500]|uniref:DUF4082 domain-containing protein n=1 Tax=Catenuloplanes sp. NPDC051500 TaxID=3363959 RepID=UPI00379AE3DC